MAKTAVSLMSADQFLVWCLDQEDKWELVEGLPVKMMTGVSRRHDRIVVNIIAALHNQLRDSRCQPMTADVAVKTRIRGVRRSDVMVACDDPRADEYDATEPRLVVEVLSPTNKGIAWVRKLDEYRRLAPLTYILPIESDMIGATLYTRAGTDWEPFDAETLQAVLELPEIGCRLTMAEIYGGLEYPAAGVS